MPWWEIAGEVDRQSLIDMRHDKIIELKVGQSDLPGTRDAFNAHP